MAVCGAAPVTMVKIMELDGEFGERNIQFKIIVTLSGVPYLTKSDMDLFYSFIVTSPPQKQ